MEGEKFCHCKSKVAGIVPKGTKEGIHFRFSSISIRWIWYSKLYYTQIYTKSTLHSLCIGKCGRGIPSILRVHSFISLLECKYSQYNGLLWHWGLCISLSTILIHQSVCIGTGVSNIDEIYYSYQKIEGKENPKYFSFSSHYIQDSLHSLFHAFLATLLPAKSQWDIIWTYIFDWVD